MPGESILHKKVDELTSKFPSKPRESTSSRKENPFQYSLKELDIALARQPPMTQKIKATMQPLT